MAPQCFCRQAVWLWTILLNIEQGRDDIVRNIHSIMREMRDVTEGCWQHCYRGVKLYFTTACLAIDIVERMIWDERVSMIDIFMNGALGCPLSTTVFCDRWQRKDMKRQHSQHCWRSSKFFGLNEETASDTGPCKDIVAIRRQWCCCWKCWTNNPRNKAMVKAAAQGNV